VPEGRVSASNDRIASGPASAKRKLDDCKLRSPPDASALNEKLYAAAIINVRSPLSWTLRSYRAGENQ
jgi:hypothetical protein